MNLPNKSKHRFQNRIERLMVNEEEQRGPEETKLLVAGLLGFFLMMFLQSRPEIPFLFKGAFAQVQVLISVFLTASIPGRGYVIVFAANLLAAFAVGLLMLISGDLSLLSGIIVPFGTIATVSVLSLLLQQLIRRYQESRRQQLALQDAHDEIEAREEEMEAQNKQLTEYSQVLEESERKLAWLASYDSLTALPNRKRLMDRLESRIRMLDAQEPEVLRYGQEIAVTFIDLDNFKGINDTAGHHVGDQVLNLIVGRMQALLHEDDLLGRLGGDEFALLVNRPLREEEMVQYLDSIRHALEEPVQTGNFTFSISASFGVATYPRDGKTVTELLKCADTAMYKAKSAGRNDIRFFTPDMEAEIRNRMEMESLLLHAVENGEISLVYQCQYYTSDLSLRGVEVLARWHSPELGTVPPGVFIPLAEAQGFILPLGKWVFRQACLDIMGLRQEDRKGIILSINISPAQIHHPLFVEMVTGLLEETGYPADQLELEITESVAISSFDSVIRHLEALRGMGVRIALDDFGTGFSSLYYLQELPIDILKIDRSFIQSIGTVEGRDHVVGGIILLSHRMGIQVIAEGVETEAQHQFLREHACDGLQGYLLAKPMPLGQVMEKWGQTQYV